MHRYALRDDQWDKIKDFLPGREGHVGGTAADNRLFVDAVIYRYRTGIPWRDLPERLGNWNSQWRRFDRWAKAGRFAALAAVLRDPDLDLLILDSTVIRAHPCAAGASKKTVDKPPRAWDARAVASRPSCTSRLTAWGTLSSSS